MASFGNVFVPYTRVKLPNAENPVSSDVLEFYTCQEAECDLPITANEDAIWLHRLRECVRSAWPAC